MSQQGSPFNESHSPASINGTASRDILNETQSARLESWQERDARQGITYLVSGLTAAVTTSTRVAEAVQRFAPPGTSPQLIQLGTHVVFGLFALMLLKAIFTTLLLLGGLGLGVYVLFRYNTVRVQKGQQPINYNPVQMCANQGWGNSAISQLRQTGWGSTFLAQVQQTEWGSAAISQLSGNGNDSAAFATQPSGSVHGFSQNQQQSGHSPGGVQAAAPSEHGRPVFYPPS